MIRQIRSACRHAKGLLQIYPEDIWLASYPRSGNTRLRMLLGQALLLNRKSDERCVPGNVEDIMPVWGFSNLSKFADTPRFIKTHRMYLPFMCGPRRAVYIVRDPRESVASSFRMHSSRKNVTSLSFEEFLKHPRHGLPGWIRMHQSWIPHATSVVNYRDLMFDVAGTVSRMCAELGVDYSPETIRTAASMTDKKNAAMSEKKDGIRDAGRFDGTFKAVGPGNHKYAQELFEAQHTEYLNRELKKANIELETLIGNWAADSNEFSTKISFRSSCDVSATEIIELFRDSNVASVTSTFRAFDLSDQQAQWIADYTGKDNYDFAFSDGKIAGMGMLRGWDEGYEIPSLGLFVSPNFQGFGVGKAIMNHLTSLAMSRSCDRIRLTVDTVNERAVNLYKAQNYEIDAAQSDRDRLVMYRKLKTTATADR